MRRLNVQFSQIDACIRTSKFAVDMLPRNPPLEQGEPLLLQLVKADAGRMGLLERRIQFALILDRVVRDVTGGISREHWPAAKKSWTFILDCSETVPCIPFSLEQLNLSKSYDGQTNPMYIVPPDEARIRPYLRIGREPVDQLPPLSVEALLTAIRNHDRVVELEPAQTSTVHDHERRLRDPFLGNALKQLYEHRCQICLHDFKPKYKTPYADIRFLQALKAGGRPVSRNSLVVCPNHNAIIGAARPTYDPSAMAFRYANGLVEKVTLRDHLLN